ncbi:MAG: phospholipase [Actinomycetota bacterium]|nr:phospholipase [Actinomycetota bacterium]
MGHENRKILRDRTFSRGEFLRLVGGGAIFSSVGLLAACGGERGSTGAGESSEGRGEVGSASGQGRLLARPRARASAPPAPPTGLRALELGRERDGLLYVPPTYEASRPAPLALTLHGAGGDARGGISPFLGLAEEAGLVLLAPESRGRTWDVLVGGYGPDVEFIDRALQRTFDRLAVDTGTLGIAGFSDGASYALSLGLTNGDLFGHVIAFSPGFSAPQDRRGKPPVFVSHGTDDEVLPIDRTSRRIVPQLERSGYRVRYEEFDGPHTVPEAVARDALRWFTSNGGRRP